MTKIQIPNPISFAYCIIRLYKSHIHLRTKATKNSTPYYTQQKQTYQQQNLVLKFCLIKNGYTIERATTPFKLGRW